MTRFFKNTFSLQKDSEKNVAFNDKTIEDLIKMNFKNEKTKISSEAVRVMSELLKANICLTGDTVLSHSTLYPDVLKKKTIIVVNKNL